MQCLGNIRCVITPDNLPDFLALLGFAKTKTKSVWHKAVGSTTLEVDFAKQQLIYPETQGLKVNERQTCTFSSNENFVVFECVHRLLEKGYIAAAPARKQAIMQRYL